MTRIIDELEARIAALAFEMGAMSGMSRVEIELLRGRVEALERRLEKIAWGEDFDLEGRPK